jgi:hypothetical protein
MLSNAWLNKWAIYMDKLSSNYATAKDAKNV